MTAPWAAARQAGTHRLRGGARLVQADDDLQRDQVSVNVAVECVPALLLVAQQDRRWLSLPCGVAHIQPLVERVRPRCGRAELACPVPGDREQVRVERPPQVLDQLREWMPEVSVLPGPEPVPGHVYRGAKALGIVVERGDAPAFGRAEQLRRAGTPVVVDLRHQPRPVGLGHAGGNVAHLAHTAPSNASNAFLA